MRLLALLSLLFLSARALPHDDRLTHVDTENDAAWGSGSGRGFDTGGSGHGSGYHVQYDERKWVTYRRNGGIHVASAAEVAQLQDFIDRSTEREASAFASAGPTQLEDGPAQTDHTKVHSPGKSRQSTLSVQYDRSVELVRNTHFYPSSAIGMMENGCAAFMVGPQHAITAAHCVYSSSTSAWNRQLSLWRGRNLERYLQFLEWDHVSISLEYFVSGLRTHDWALITFAEQSKSPVWLRLGSSDMMAQDTTFTLYGYTTQNDELSAMSFTKCRSRSIQLLSEYLTMQCGTTQNLQGGPILIGDISSQWSLTTEMSPVYGLGLTDQSICPERTALRFHSELFWQLCWLMDREGFQSRCSPYQW